MFSVFMLSAAAATLGGLDSPGGAVIGGLSLGVIESLVGNYPEDWPGSDWIGIETKTAVAFLIILVVLLVRPVRPVRLGQGGAGLIDADQVIKSGSALHWVLRALVAVGLVAARVVDGQRGTSRRASAIHRRDGAGHRGVVAEPAVRFNGQISLGHSAFAGISAFYPRLHGALLGQPAVRVAARGVRAVLRGRMS